MEGEQADIPQTIAQTATVQEEKAIIEVPGQAVPTLPPAQKPDLPYKCKECSMQLENRQKLGGHVLHAHRPGVKGGRKKKVIVPQNEQLITVKPPVPPAQNPEAQAEPTAEAKELLELRHKVAQYEAYIRKAQAEQNQQQGQAQPGNGQGILSPNTLNAILPTLLQKFIEGRRPPEPSITEQIGSLVISNFAKQFSVEAGKATGRNAGKPQQGRKSKEKEETTDSEAPLTRAELNSAIASYMLSESQKGKKPKGVEKKAEPMPELPKPEPVPEEAVQESKNEVIEMIPKDVKPHE